MRARLVIEGAIHKEFYIVHEHLSRGSTISREEERLPYLYVQYSDHYLNGQKITANTVDYIYSCELHDVAKVNSYMSLWQLAQAASVLEIPIWSVYPTGSDPIMRKDFHRIFYPRQHGDDNSKSQSIMIMWTSSQMNSVPNHFVPLVNSSDKYAFHNWANYINLFLVSVSALILLLLTFFQTYS